MKRVFLVHKWGGNYELDWFPWLKKNLENAQYEVVEVKIPDPENPVIKDWVTVLSNAVGAPDEDTYFVGHSIGCQTIVRYLETIDKKVGGAVFVAGWFNLANLEGEETEKIANPWINIPIDLEKVKNNLKHSRLIISDNDPYEYFDLNKEKFSELGSEILVLLNAGHIRMEDGYSKLPEALEFFV